MIAGYILATVWSWQVTSPSWVWWTDPTNDDSPRLFYLYTNKVYFTQARWDEASRVAIRVMTKPCPNCRTATERDGELDYL